jgi:hypothetical protein
MSAPSQRFVEAQNLRERQSSTGEAGDGTPSTPPASPQRRDDEFSRMLNGDVFSNLTSARPKRTRKMPPVLWTDC